jgi:beta-galactosidase
MHRYPGYRCLNTFWNEPKYGKPYLMIEYAHASGNALGNFDMYWDIVEKNPSIIGGFIWDWVNQNFNEKAGSRTFAKGVIFADRTIQPEMLEVKNVHQFVGFKLVSAERGEVEIHNKYYLKESANTLDLNGRDFSVRFDKKGGRITSLKSGGFECIAQGKDITGPELNIHCLPVGNDRPFRKSWAESDLAHPKSETVSFNASKQPDGSVVVSILKKIEYKGGSIEHQLDYTISDGVIKLSNKVTPDGLDEILTLPRMGLKMGLAKTFEQVEWVGRGPHENYPDRKSSAFIGTYKSTVTEMATPYVGAQEKGARCDVRRVKLSTPDKKAPAVVMEASEPFVFSALHCDAGNWQQPRKETILCIDHKMLGLGNGSCGPATLKRFWVPVQPYQFDFTLSVQ